VLVDWDFFFGLRKIVGVFEICAASSLKMSMLRSLHTLMLASGELKTLPCYILDPPLQLINALIIVMPHYHRYGLNVGICIPENYNSPPTGEVLAIQTRTYPDKSPSSETCGKWG